MIRNREGFTLIELLIVVVIIGILAAIAIPKFANTKEKAYYTAMKSDLRNLMTAEESYFSDSSQYSANPTDLNNFKTSTGVAGLTIVTGQGFWTATVTHSQLTAGKNCVIAINTPNANDANANDGEPVCR
jgi:prepilin-type N-terminal cleavage/methylation domain-containing protein